MSKKDYVRIAAALLAEKPGANWDPNKRVQWELDVKAVATALAGGNDAFNRAKFLKAAGIETT